MPETASVDASSSAKKQPQTLTEAIELAQLQGSAERDVSRDIGGWDSIAKTVLLANFGLFPESKPARLAHSEGKEFQQPEQFLQVSDIRRTGLDDGAITSETVAHWKKMGQIPRLTSTIERSLPDKQSGKSTAGPWTASVALEHFASPHPFTALRGKAKGIVTSTTDMGDVFASAAEACGPEPDATVASAMKDFRQWLARLS